MYLKDNKGGSKLYILGLVGISIVSLMIGLIGGVWLGRNLWWTNNDNNYKPFVPSEQECTRDFKEGITTLADLIKVRGAPTKVTGFGDFFNFQYRTNPDHDVGCSYSFDKDGKLHRILIYLPSVG